MISEPLISRLLKLHACRAQDIRALFPPEYNPFYAGFGNRDTDEISYLTVGIPAAKIFIINPRGAPRHLRPWALTRAAARGGARART